jgi:hypothetical protein
MRMPREHDTESLHRPNPAQSGGVCGELAFDLCDQPFVPLRKETFAPY